MLESFALSRFDLIIWLGAIFVQVLVMLLICQDLEFDCFLLPRSVNSGSDSASESTLGLC